MEKREISDWQKVRRLCYQQYLSTPLKEGFRHDDIYDFMPLPGDPSRKEIDRARVRQEREAIKKQQREAEKLIKQYQKLGYL